MGVDSSEGTKMADTHRTILTHKSDVSLTMFSYRRQSSIHGRHSRRADTQATTTAADTPTKEPPPMTIERIRHGTTSTSASSPPLDNKRAAAHAAESVSMMRSSSGWSKLEHWLPFRITFKMRIITFLASGLMGFFLIIYIVLHIDMDQAIAQQRAFRSYVTSQPLSERRHRFEELIASQLLKQPIVQYSVDELLRRTSQLASIDRITTNDLHHPSPERMTHSDTLEFLFGTHDRRIGGSIGSNVEKIRKIIETPLMGQHQQQHDDNDDDDGHHNLDDVNLREKMTLLYIAVMQPAKEEKIRLLDGNDRITKEEVEFYSIQSDNNIDRLTTTSSSLSSSFNEQPPPTIFPLSFLLRRELEHRQRIGSDLHDTKGGDKIDWKRIAEKLEMEVMNGDIHRTHLFKQEVQRLVDDTMIIDSSSFDTKLADSMILSDISSLRKCFLPLFVPLSGPVRSCRCYDSKHEPLKGCRRLRLEEEIQLEKEALEYSWGSVPPHIWLTTSRTASSTRLPRLSRRELEFAFTEMMMELPSDITFADLEPHPIYTHTILPWLSGMTIFTTPSQSDNEIWLMIQQYSQRYGRFIAGPSSTTDAILQLTRYMGLNEEAYLYAIRLGLIAYLIPSYDHSIFEILIASLPFKLQPSLDDLMHSSSSSSSSSPMALDVDSSSFESSPSYTFTHLIPKSLCLETKFDSSKKVRRTKDDEDTDDVVDEDERSIELREKDCITRDGIFISRNRLVDSIALAILSAFAPAHIQHEATRSSEVNPHDSTPDVGVDPNSPTASATDDSKSARLSGGCSARLAAYWRIFGLERSRPPASTTSATSDSKNQRHRQDHAGSDNATHTHTGTPCQPELMLSWITRNVYQS